MLFWKILFLLSFSTLVDCKKLLKSLNEVETPKKPLFFVSGLISDWSSKTSETSDVIVLHDGKKSFYVENILQAVPKSNAVTFLLSNRCNKIEEREATFIVMIVENYKAVSDF